MSTTASLLTLRRRQSKDSRSQRKKRWVTAHLLVTGWFEPCMWNVGLENCVWNSKWFKAVLNMKMILILFFFFAARYCVNTKLCCRSNKTGCKTFPGVWLPFPWRRGKHRPHSFIQKLTYRMGRVNVSDLSLWQGRFWVKWKILNVAFCRWAMAKEKRRATSLPFARSVSSPRETPTGRRPAIHSTQTLWTGYDLRQKTITARHAQ